MFFPGDESSLSQWVYQKFTHTILHIFEGTINRKHKVKLLRAWLFFARHLISHKRSLCLVTGYNRIHPFLIWSLGEFFFPFKQLGFPPKLYQVISVKGLLSLWIPNFSAFSCQSIHSLRPLEALPRSLALFFTSDL